MKNLITAETRVQDALRMRPLLAELLGKRGIDFWSDLEKPLRDKFHRERGGALEDFLAELDHLAVPAADCWWQELPVAHLLDFLTQEHREFQLSFVTDIDYMLDVQSLADRETAPEILKLQSEFHSFVTDLEAEIENEETRLFPRILRYEACLRNPRVHPEFQEGSLQIGIAARAAHFASRRRKAFPSFLSRSRRAEALHPENSGLTLLTQRVKEFEAALEAHESLEMETLFPMALEMERTLYNLSIDGAHLVSHRVRGPMDSGILRLGTT